MIAVHQKFYGCQRESELQTKLKNKEEYTFLKKKENVK